MKDNPDPIPENELLRLISLSRLSFDYTNHIDEFKDLTQLAAKVAGTEMSLINIIDSFTQWSISSFGTKQGQVPREESVCQHTIMSKHPLEIQDFNLDERFNAKDFVKGSAGLSYYYGLPLEISEGINIGTLCLIDSKVKSLSPEKAELLALIAESVVKRIKCSSAVKILNSQLSECNESKRKAAHDIRGPLLGIIGLSELISVEDMAGDAPQQMSLINMIHDSSKSLLELAEDILSDSNNLKPSDTKFNLRSFKDILERLYMPQALHKNVELKIHLNSEIDQVLYSKNELIQVAGNLVSNAIKFTPSGGKIEIELSFEKTSSDKLLKIQVSDNGIGMDTDLIKDVISGRNGTTLGTLGEKGYGYGLGLVIHLINSLKGKLNVASKKGEGTVFSLTISQEGIDNIQ
jgi:K+-sensing histidine kinase KdpD